MSTSITPIRLTIEDLDATPDDGNRYELIDGEIYVSGVPGWNHQGILMNLAALLWNYLRKNPIGSVVPGVGVTFDDHNSVVPDLIYASRDRLLDVLNNERLVGAPQIAIEILSTGASNVRRDRRFKLNLYSAGGVDEYWIADPISQCVEIYRRSGPGGFDVHLTLRRAEEIASPLLPGFSAKAYEIL